MRDLTENEIRIMKERELADNISAIHKQTFEDLQKVELEFKKQRDELEKHFIKHKSLGNNHRIPTINKDTSYSLTCDFAHSELKYSLNQPEDHKQYGNTFSVATIDSYTTCFPFVHARILLYSKSYHGEQLILVLNNATEIPFKHYQNYQFVVIDKDNFELRLQND